MAHAYTVLFQCHTEKNSLSCPWISQDYTS